MSFPLTYNYHSSVIAVPSTNHLRRHYEPSTKDERSLFGLRFLALRRCSGEQAQLWIMNYALWIVVSFTLRLWELGNLPYTVHGIYLEVANRRFASPELQAVVIVGEMPFEGIAIQAAIYEDLHAGAIDVHLQVEVKATRCKGWEEIRWKNVNDLVSSTKLCNFDRNIVYAQPYSN